MDPYSDISKRAVGVLAKASYQLWQDEHFRKYLDFVKLSQIEQDRVFNELEVTAMGVMVLQVAGHPILSSLEPKMISSFLDLMRGLGIEEELIVKWQNLINIRLSEYKKSYDLAIEESENWEKFVDDEYVRFIWARVETQAICGLSHIRLGQVEVKDPLWDFLRKWLITIDSVFSQMIKASPLKGEIWQNLN